MERIYSENHLSQSVPTAIIQDHRGLIWIGTQDGLNRYDGYKFKIYKHDVFDDSSLSGNYIIDLYEDPEGYLWVATRSAGLDRFDWKTDRFKHHRYDPSKPNGISNDSITAVIGDHNGYLWVGTTDGLDRLDKGTGIFTHYRKNPLNRRSLGCNAIRDLFIDSRKNLWIGTERGGLNRFDPQSNSFVSFRHNPDDPNNPRNPGDNSIQCIFEDTAGILWLGTTRGLSRFDPLQNSFRHFSHHPSNPQSISHNTIRCIVEDNRRRLWLGTGAITMDGNGISIMDKKKATFHRYIHRGRNAFRLSNSSIPSLYKARQGTIWIGTFGSGVYKYDPQKFKFAHFKHEPEAPNSLSRNEIWALCEDRKGDLWVGVLDGGLNFLDRETGRFTLYTHDPKNPNSLSDNSIRAILEDSDGFLWLSTDKGLDRFDRRNKRFTHFQYREDQRKSLSSNLIVRLLEDSRQNLLMATWGSGVFRLEKKTGNFIPFPSRENGGPFRDKRIPVIYEDSEQAMWVGTIAAGLYRLAPGGAITRYLNDPGNSNSISSNSIMAIHEGPKGIFWLGTWGGGLNRLDVSTNSISHFTIKNGLSNDTIYGILGDANGNLWISTNNGLSKFSPVSGLFTNYSRADGLQDREFNQGAYFKGASGYLYFGGIGGFNAFLPQRITNNPYTPPLVITDFRIFEKSVKPDPKGTFQYLASNGVEVNLSYRQNHISFEFASLEFANPLNNRYEYKMDGLDENWILCGNRRYVNYTNLDGGSYTLRIKASNNGRWNEKGIIIHITVTPPFWETWWFKVLASLAVVCLILLLFALRTRALRKRLAREKQIQEKLKQSKTDLQKAKEMIQFRHAETLKLMASISSILVAVDWDKNIYLWNEPAEAFFNIPREECVGKNIVDVLSHCIKKELLEEILQKGFASDSGVEEWEIDVGFNRLHHLLQVVVNPIRDKGGNRRGILLLAEDIGNRKAQLAQENLLLKLKSIGEMFAGIMHEINTPLQYIGISNKIITDAFAGLNHWMKEGKNLETTQIKHHMENGTDAAARIYDGLEQIMEVVKTIKAYFHPGKETMEMCDITTLVKSALLVSTYRFRRTCNVKTHFCSQSLLTYCYPAELNLVFLNLLSNAADAIRETRERGEITLSTKTQGDKEIVIQISDTGVGIPQDIEEKIFNPFFTTKGVGKGTGQGLSFALKIIEEKHRGRLYFRSAPGKGTDFFIHIPIRQNQ